MILQALLVYYFYTHNEMGFALATGILLAVTALYFACATVVKLVRG